MRLPNEMIGKIIANRWQIVEYLGEGTMSYVYQAKDVETGKIIALKLIKSTLLNHVADLEKLAQQAKAFIALNHENIANYYDIYYANNQLFLFCDYLRGESLESLLSKVGKLPIDKCVNLFQQIATGLEYAHENKMRHGDLRPSNIFIVNDEFNHDEPKIVDFGLMQLIECASQENNLRTTTNHPIFGSAPYMSPEQRMGQAVDERADLYSLGCLMYEAACGKSPLTSKSAMETTYKQRSQIPTELFKLLPTHPFLDRYQLITNKLLQSQPRQRLQSASLVKQDLDLLVRAKDPEWQRKANVLKQGKYQFYVTHKWSLLGSIILCSLLAAILWQLIPLVSYYCQPWTGGAFDNNKLWIKQEKNIDKPPMRLMQQKELLQAKLSQIEQSEGKASPTYFKCLIALAQCLLSCGQWDEAKAKFSELQNIANTSKLVDPLEFAGNLALCQLTTGDKTAAEVSAQKILSVSQSQDKYIDSKITAFKILGDIYTERNEIAKAENAYNQLFQLTKNYRLNRPAEYAYAQAVLADIYRKENKLGQSESLYKESIDWGNNYIGHGQIFMAKALYGLALVYYQQGNYLAARRSLQQALPIVIARRGLKNDFVLAINQFNDYLLFHQNIFAWAQSNWENKK